MLDIESDVDYSDIITGMEYHVHKPYASSTFKNNDEIRIPVSQQDVITAPFESTLHITGTLSGKKADNSDASVSLVINAMAYLFDEIRYEIGGVQLDRTKNVGITTTIKNCLSIQSGEEAALKNACWLGVGNTLKTTKFSFSVPLKLLLGFAEDYKKVVMNVKQELILLRSASDLNAIHSADANAVTLTITAVDWRVPHVTVSDVLRLRLLQLIEQDTKILVPFRSWELHEYPVLPTTNRQSWAIKTSSQLEKPRYVILAFQTARKNEIKKDMSQFDACKLSNVKVYLNSQYYPYDNVHGDQSIFYEMFSRFQNSYYGRNTASPIVTLDKFKDNTPLYVIDCSKQDDSIMTGPVDVRLEFETDEAIAANTTAYCLLLHDSYFSYTLLRGSVKSVM